MYVTNTFPISLCLMLQPLALLSEAANFQIGAFLNYMGGMFSYCSENTVA